MECHLRPDLEVPASPFIPVEAILKVEDCETLKTGLINDEHNTQDPEGNVTPAFVSIGIQCQPFETEQESHERFPNVDYKTRNKIKTKHRRQDSFYRDQERVRQRAVMHLKRQDPTFRAVEREKGRCRMRIKRLDPVFRTKERERQKERMKQKRQDPSFRENERKLQKKRSQEKKNDLYFCASPRTKSQFYIQSNPNNNDFVPRKIKFEHNGKDFPSSGMDNLHCYEAIPESERKNISPYTNHVDAKSSAAQENDFVLETLNYRTPHVFNVHFCSNEKEMWNTSVDKLSKATFLFNMFKGDFQHQNAVTSAINQSEFLSPVRMTSVHAENDVKEHLTSKGKGIICPQIEKEKQDFIDCCDTRMESEYKK